ncbi:NOL1/NOP2/Sun domain member 3 [Chytridiales sp. JEL 0842]|nr:NOL1/NOP2/Sun domain member 3 [Chytridiales sp. JEL 0842]
MSSTKKLSKTKQKELARREAALNAFSKFFEDLYGATRWSTLLPALQAPVRYCCMVNKYADPHDVVKRLQTVEAELKPLDWLTGGVNCFVVDSDEPISVAGLNSSSSTVSLPATSTTPPKSQPAALPFPSPAFDMKNIKTHYLMDAASILATESLDVQPDDTILDMCAAPGGKSLCILQRLGPNGKLTCNEMSQDRKTRLKRVLKEYIPPTILSSCVEVTGYDATQPKSFPEAAYKKVLCDAPCSSERHVLHDPEVELAGWTPSRTKNSAKRQRLLLQQALRAAWDEGGKVVYATCSLSRAENDGVIEKVLKKSKFLLKVTTHERSPRSWGVGEPTKYGWIALPDAVGRWGPLYFCVLEKMGLKEVADDDDAQVNSDDDD